MSSRTQHVTRIPTAKQTEMLAAIAADPKAGYLSGGMQGSWTYYLNDVACTAAMERLINNGWVVLHEYPGPVGSVNLELTPAGASALLDGQDLIDWSALEYTPELPRVHVGRRRLGNHPVRGMGRVPDGRQVSCFEKDCPDVAARKTVVIWFTNETGASAQRDAELAQRRHGLAHVRARTESAQ